MELFVKRQLSNWLKIKPYNCLQNTVIDLEQFSSEPISSAYSYNLVNPNAGTYFPQEA